MVLWAVAAVLAAYTIIRLGGLERGTPLVQLIAFTPYVAPLALLCAAWAAIAGATGPWLLCLLAWAALSATVVPRLIARPAPPAGAAPGVPLRVMTANVLFDHGDMPALLQQAKLDDVDVLAVQELTPAALAALDTAGVDGLLPHRVAHPGRGGTGSALFSRHPLTPTGGDGLARRHDCGMRQAGATVHVPGAGDVQVESVHPCAPRPRQTRCWARNLAAQPPAGGDPPRILLGDFNATLDHAPLRRLLRTGYRDAAGTRGRGLAPTWPFRRGPGLPVAPPVTLDHVLTDRRIGIGDVATRTVPGSDHRALLAHLRLPTTDHPTAQHPTADPA
ncbi:endonuclease/exonuclease/phosphatase family protein [Dactylosporangium aurantiacum]|uniref:Endonuclease/exonuclease/phosphatase family protein n=1 Tax=Dactylosporangium aurantiacum TaxID=35754 RepID=A0A9Q9MFA0_9ACTN|nr:endonuclease/exonuclease/phosphatase family protein [Dactylosporangium aurantiacum]MDG6106545.1 endonuclease/exonuclease/phosphatase family protein [Dactylosporangium aurantiacum]UWZ50426.1 endonuclease/exonuclease/phosphatase family protein [Dactylosporangium aurantiacum]